MSHTVCNVVCGHTLTNQRYDRDDPHPNHLPTPASTHSMPFLQAPLVVEHFVHQDMWYVYNAHRDYLHIGPDPMSATQHGFAPEDSVMLVYRYLRDAEEMRQFRETRGMLEAFEALLTSGNLTILPSGTWSTVRGGMMQVMEPSFVAPTWDITRLAVGGSEVCKHCAECVHTSVCMQCTMCAALTLICLFAPLVCRGFCSVAG